MQCGRGGDGRRAASRAIRRPRRERRLGPRRGGENLPAREVLAVFSKPATYPGFADPQKNYEPDLHRHGDQTRAALAPSRAALLRRPRPPPWPPPRHGRRAPRACLAGGRTSAAGTQGRRPRLGPSWGWVRSLPCRRPELYRREAGASPRRPTSALSAGGMAGACPVRHRGAWASPRRPPGPYQGAWPELRRREVGAPPPPGPCLGAWPELHRR